MKKLLYFFTCVSLIVALGVMSASAETPLTRGELCMAIVEQLDIDIDISNLECHFSDINEDDEYYRAVMILFNLGAITGDQNGNFRPNNYVENAEAAVLLSRLVFNENLDGVPEDFVLDGVTETIWYYRYARKVAYTGVMQNVTDWNAYACESNINFAVANDLSNNGTCGESTIWSLDTKTDVFTVSGNGVVSNWLQLPKYRIPQVKTIVIEEGITEIYSEIFSNLSAVETIEFPESLVEFYDRAFANCTSLKNIVFSEGLERIGSNSFNGCTALETVTIPNTVKEIYNWAFANCTSLENITIPDGITTIGSFVFQNCTSLESITIPDSITTLYEYTFANCTSLKNVSFGEGITLIGSWVFLNCSSLETVTLPNSLQEIYCNAFENCTALKSITIPNSVTDISSYTFSGCTSLESITLSSGMTGMYAYVFDNCPALKNIIIPNSITEIGNNAFTGCSGLETLTLPDSITKIYSFAFEGCTSLKSITVPKGMDGLYGYTFYGCPALETVTMFENIEFINNNVFEGCYRLKNINIPNSVKSIGHKAFKDCVNLRALSIPQSVNGIDDTAFDGCNKLTIYCYKGSYAQTYATQNNIPFEYIQLPEIKIAAGSATAYVDGKEHLMVAPAVMKNGTLMAPCRHIIGVLECVGTTWDASTYTLTFEKDGTIVEITANATTAKVNGENVTMPEPFYTTDESAPFFLDLYHLPIQFIAEIFGNTVTFDEDTQTMTINPLPSADIDGDGMTDIKDVMLSIKAFLNGTSLGGADTTGNGIVNLLDILRILKTAIAA